MPSKYRRTSYSSYASSSLQNDANHEYAIIPNQPRRIESDANMADYHSSYKVPQVEWDPAARNKTNRAERTDSYVQTVPRSTQIQRHNTNVSQGISFTH